MSALLFDLQKLISFVFLLQEDTVFAYTSVDQPCFPSAYYGQTLVLCSVLRRLLQKVLRMGGKTEWLLFFFCA